MGLPCLNPHGSMHAPPVPTSHNIELRIIGRTTYETFSFIDETQVILFLSSEILRRPQKLEQSLTFYLTLLSKVKFETEDCYNFFWMKLKSSVVIFQALECLQSHWPWQPHWPQQPLHPYIIKELPDTDGWIIPK